MDDAIRKDVDRLKRYLDLEQYVRILEEELERMNDSIESYSRQLTGMPRGNRLSDKVGDTATKIADARDRLTESIAEADAERALLLTYLTGIEEIHMRNIMHMRYVKGFSWNQVALELNETDESYPRRQHNAYLRLHPVKKSGYLNRDGS